jgi:hypothetical protein
VQCNFKQSLILISVYSEIVLILTKLFSMVLVLKKGASKKEIEVLEKKSKIKQALM